MENFVFKFGDYVETTTYKYHGRVYMLHDRCPESHWWLEGQDIPIGPDLVNKPWISVLCDKGGAVVVPVSLAKAIDPIPGFTHSGGKDVFPED